MSLWRSAIALAATAAVLAAVAVGQSFAPPPPPADTSAGELPPIESEYEEAKERAQRRFIQEMTGRPIPGSVLPGTPYQRVQALEQVQALMSLQQEAEATSPTADLGARPSTWRPIGPDNIGGRSHSLAIDPRDSNVMYMGGIAGGVWKSNDAGRSWRPLNDTLSNIAISSLAIDPSNPDTIYAGTGDVIDAYARVGARGSGIMVSKDAGSSWSFLDSTQTAQFRYVTTVKFGEGGRLFATTDKGLMTSDDNGASWQQRLEALDRFGCFDIALAQGGGNMLVSCGVEPGGLFHSSDGGDTWQLVVGGVNGQTPGRMSVDISRSDPSVAYASVSKTDGTALAILRSDQGGADGSWQVVNTAGQQGVPAWFGWCEDPIYSADSGQGWYDNVIAVDPTNPDRIFVGGIDIFRSDDGGRTLVPISYWWLDQHFNMFEDGASDGTQYAHADQHGVAFHPNYDGNNNTTIYFLNDGGLYKSDNATASANEPCHQYQVLSGAPLPPLNKVTWTSMNNGFATTLIREGAVSESGAIGAGLQDNGTILDSEVKRSPNEWIEAVGGDGASTAIDPTGQILYGVWPGGDVFKYQGNTYRRATAGITDTDAGFVTPLEMDPSNPNHLWTGKFKLWRTTDGAGSWSAGSPAMPELPTSIAVSPKNGSFVLAGTRKGTFWRTTGGLDPVPTWETVGAGLPKAEISSIEFDPTNDQTVYVTVASFEDVGKVFKSTDGGTTFSRSDGSGASGIPDVAAYSVVVNPLNPSMVYAGTDSGVFESLDAGASWRVANDNLATTTVEDLYFRPGTSELYAFTFGRGAYSVDVGDVAPPVNDEVDTATEITGLDFKASQNTRRATTAQNDPPLACGPTSQPQQAKSVWYKLAAQTGGNVTVSSEDSNYDTVIGVFDSSSGSLQQVGCDDNSGSQATSKVTFNAQPGGTYYVEVARSADAVQEGVSGHLVLKVTAG